MEPAVTGTVRVRLLGEDLVLKGDDPIYLERLAAELDVQLKRLAAALKLQSQPTHVALLVAINLLDELTRLKAREQSASSAAATMVKRIEHVLRAEEPELFPEP